MFAIIINSLSCRIKKKRFLEIMRMDRNSKERKKKPKLIELKLEGMRMKRLRLRNKMKGNKIEKKGERVKSLRTNLYWREVW